MSSWFVAHYGEIGTKGTNRPAFERSLERNVKNSLRGLPGLRVRRAHQRILLAVDDEAAAEARMRLGKVFGLAWYAGVQTTKPAYTEILAAALAALGRPEPDSSFRVSARRSDKSFPMSSLELASKLGEDIITKLDLKVDLSHPGVTLHVDVLRDQALVYSERIKGLGGLPVGSSGRVLHLLSGGIDSPVAAWLMMKRGCRPTYLHFYLAPGPQSVVQSKLVEMIGHLEGYGGDREVILVPFAPYQLATTDLPQEFEPVVFRRFVRMVAERLASRLGYPAISTGDNLAQVASQTLQNMVCIDSGSTVPTLRPLLTYDKDEIVQLAKRIGTYETSLKEYKDCCSIISRHPRTRMKVGDVDEAARRFAFDELAERCLAMADAVRVAEGQSSVRPLAELIAEHGERSAQIMSPRG